MSETDSDIRVVRVTTANLSKFEEFLRKEAIEAESGNPNAPREFVDGLRTSLSTFDFLSSGSHWLLAAEISGGYVGYLTAVRVHKADGRVAVLYIDELSVLCGFRRRGVATALWQETKCLAREIGAWRIRLTVRPGNEGARAFYRSVGLEESPLFLCEQEVRETDD